MVTKINRNWERLKLLTRTHTHTQQDWSSRNRNTIIILVVWSDLFYTKKIGRLSFKRFPCSFIHFEFVFVFSLINTQSSSLVFSFLCRKRSNFRCSKFEWCFHVCTLVLWIRFVPSLSIFFFFFFFWSFGTEEWLNNNEFTILIQIERESRLHTS